MRTIRFNNNRHISSSPLLRTEGGREASVSDTSGDKIPKGKFSFLLLFFLLFLGSCSSDFLDSKPTDAVDSGLVPVPSNAERIFNGAWYNLFEYGTTYANIGYRALMCLDDMMADDVVSRPMYGFNSSYQFNDVVMPSDGRTTFAWYLMYKTIDNCNTAISIQATGDDDTPEFRHAQGQALAVRAFCYLHLAQHYQFTYLKDKNALCVPLYTEPTNPNTKPKGKATLEEIYTQIINDLNRAKGLLDGYVRPNDKSKYKPNTDVVNGLLARTYLLTGQWDEAAKAALEAAKGYTLMTDAKNYMGFNDISNTEWIWGHPQSVSQSDASYNFYYLDVVEPDSYNSFMADPHFKDTFTEGDIRLELFQWMREGYLGYRKFRIRSDQTGDIVIMRSAEMYLIAAEALARKGQLGEAVKPLNTLRNARGLADYDLTGKNQEQVIDEILMERRRELWGEGFGITDVLRTQRPVVRVALTEDEAAKEYDCWQQNGTYKKYHPEGHWFTSFPDGTKFVPNSIYYLYSIPEKETNANTNLK
ncbi:RagB/SusD family nutrient uptake outer membrane protein [Bacteroides fragilis]|uniref:RagB/SusD family nutrient uptake outer membrane protein n=1 Tax=Bacteroides fragilis TaxID=817 RepID=UPI0015F150A4|nr:RagB/SusD family nutrient uptake outer membrane protein [Bacteroides fragilis]